MEKIYSVFSRNDLGLFLELLLFTSNQSHLFFCPAVSHTPLTTGHYICSADGKTNTDTFMSSLHTHTINICVVLYTEYRVFTLVVFFSPSCSMSSFGKAVNARRGLLLNGRARRRGHVSQTLAWFWTVT